MKSSRPVGGSCAKPDTGQLIGVLPMGGIAPYRWEIYDNQNRLIEPGAPGLLATGNYSLVLMDANNCTLIRSFELPNTRSPRVQLSVDNEFPTLGESIQLQLSGEYLDSLAWQPDSLFTDNTVGPITFRPLRSTTVSVTAISRDGCSQTDSIRIRVAPNDKVYLPTAFSPNFDGINDFFEAFPGLAVESFGQLSIYDRWGGLIYTSPATFYPTPQDRTLVQNTSPRWDGMDAQARLVPGGVYFYRLPVIFLDGRSSLLSGSVTVVR